MDAHDVQDVVLKVSLLFLQIQQFGFIVISVNIFELWRERMKWRCCDCAG